MTRLLVSVRDVPEALLAARHGADLIDLKEPGAGALGGLPTAVISSIVAALHGHGISLPVSATIGDMGMGLLDAILARVDAVAACGVDYVKVGIERQPEAEHVLTALAASGQAVVPVFIADRGLDFADVERARELGFPAVMVDTADKRVGSLFDVMAEADLRRFVAVLRADRSRADRRCLVGVAGALRLQHLPALVDLHPDFAGFRSAVCQGDRSGALDAERLATLVRRLRDLATPSIAQIDQARQPHSRQAGMAFEVGDDPGIFGTERGVVQ